MKNIHPANWLSYVLDASLFARDMLQFEPDATQTRVLRDNPRRFILNCNRQWGKSTITSILVAHRAIFVPESLSVIVGPSERQSAETLRKVRRFLHIANIRATSDRINRNSLVLPHNQSRIVALPSSGDKIRGFSSVSLLVFDEASRIADPLYQSMRPSIAVSGGDVALISTPLGKRGFFYREFSSGGPQWKRYTVPASQCPRIPQQFLEEERITQGEEYFAQEYECQFVEDGRFLFTDEDCQRLFKTDVQPLNIHNRKDPSWRNVMKPVPLLPQTAVNWSSNNVDGRDEE
jgi:hypothetical protein